MCAALPRLARACAAPVAPGQLKARVDLGEAAVSPDVLAPADDAVGERTFDFRPSSRTSKLAALLFADIKPAAIAFRRDEHVIVAALITLAKSGVEPDDGAPVLELRRAEILEPMLRALDAMQHALRTVGNATMAFFTAGRERADDDGVARKEAGERVWVGSLADHAGVTGGEAEDTDDAFDVPITPGRSPDVPTTPAVVGMFIGTGGPCVLEMPVPPLTAPRCCERRAENDAARTAVPANDTPCAPSFSLEKPMTPGRTTPAP